MSEPITVLLVDDHPLVRRGFRRLLEDDAGMRVIGEAGSGEEALSLYPALLPDVVVMDSAMPGMGGLAATRALLELSPAARVVMLSMHSEKTLVRQALDAGARGYVLKSAVDLDLVAVVKQIHAGETVIDPAMRRAPAIGEHKTRLTPRELEVLQHICAGQSNKEIAATLGVSVNTVAVHRSRIMNTLDVHKTAELVMYALQHGLINPL